ncbi:MULTISPECIES: hypothetical protein [Streptobacillus]|uniref:hypothetical protein n=1 Tax=Streptobacillus TaxID=34104 RepID=UPI000A899C6D|nr:MULTISPECIES: hypothetical protein [Streptobacillus]
MLDTITDLLGILNNSQINLNVSYDDLISCSLYELQYWINRGNRIVEMLKEQNE